jgi:hypothetical protein
LWAIQPTCREITDVKKAVSQRVNQKFCHFLVHMLGPKEVLVYLVDLVVGLGEIRIEDRDGRLAILCKQGRDVDYFISLPFLLLFLPYSLEMSQHRR